ncbi:balbiani ring protein 3-like [Ischnura elegans]|uniref:balbiani ring protein 3-like n=1 Tax=Ischnura elegans TaxID=197161 RepID=UPI001ED88D26|nr:balbiani ring protein 3-like [Ischnura elegans]
MKFLHHPLASLSIIFIISVVHASPHVDRRDISKRYSTAEDSHVFQELGSCDRKFFRKFSKVVMNSNCMPRPIAVDLIPESPYVLLVPSKVVVDRCSGECHAKLSCMPTNKTTMAIEVEQLNVLDENSGFKCGIVNVEVHTRCRCDCNVMEYHCNSKQLYFPKKCMCLCMNDEERRICHSKGGGRYWNANTCRCECHTERECSTGLFWIPERCSCAKLMPEELNTIEDSS